MTIIQFSAAVRRIQPAYALATTTHSPNFHSRRRIESVIADGQSKRLRHFSKGRLDRRPLSYRRRRDLAGGRV